MTLTCAIEAYVTLKRSLGAVFTAQAAILRAFGRTVGDLPLDAITTDACTTFCRGLGPPTRFWENKHHTLRGFFHYLVSRGYLATSPLQEPGPRAQRSFRPYIYSHEELQRLLAATGSLTSARFPLQPLTYRTLLLVLYGAGLRASEALRLRLSDVDLHNRLLSIWDTKFFKARVVPIGLDLGMVLATYRQARESLPKPAGARSTFFAARNGGAVSRQQLEKVFQRLRHRAAIRRPATDRWQPRLHDLRHTMAVHRVIAWYREGVDVEAHLPLLATYLGHVDVSGTQIYLSMTPELLAEASARFERYASAGKEDDHGKHPLDRPVGTSLLTGRGWDRSQPECQHPAKLS
jgi:site-specific recombinase XerD